MNQMSGMNARVHVATMREADWRYAYIVDAEWSDWKQVSGDVGAAVFGCEFGRVCSERYENSPSIRKSVQLIRITNLETQIGEDFHAGAAGPYQVEHYSLEPWNLSSREREMFNHLVQILPADDATTADQLLMQVAVEMVSDFGGYEDEPTSYPSLGEAMRENGIPAIALWEPSQANILLQWGSECKYLVNEYIHPRANHIRRLAHYIAHELWTGASERDVAKQLTHLKHLVDQDREHGDGEPDWYNNGIPTEQWVKLETF